MKVFLHSVSVLKLDLKKEDSSMDERYTVIRRFLVIEISFFYL